LAQNFQHLVDLFFIAAERDARNLKLIG